MKNKNVLFIINDFTTIYHFRMELLRRLVAEGYNVSVAIPDDERNEKLKENGATIYNIPLSRFGTNPLADFKTMLAIRKVLKIVKPAIAFTYTAKPNIYGGMACSLEKVPYIANVTGLGVNFANGNLISKIMLMLQKIGLKKANMVCFQNESNRDLFVQHGIAEKSGKVIPGSGVNLDENFFVEYPNNDVIKFVSTARIRKDKGYDELFDAIKMCKEAGINAEFHVVGWYEDDEYKSVVQQMQDEYGVVFYDYVPHDEIHDLMSKFDCLIQPSHHEGMSNVILEIAATGRPSIVSNIFGCKEAVDDGKTGYIFEVKNSNDLFEKIKKFVALSREEREQMGIDAREFMKENFDRNIVVQTYMDEVYKATSVPLDQ